MSEQTSRCIQSVQLYQHGCRNDIQRNDRGERVVNQGSSDVHDQDDFDHDAASEYSGMSSANTGPVPGSEFPALANLVGKGYLQAGVIVEHHYRDHLHDPLLFPSCISDNLRLQGTTRNQERNNRLQRSLKSAGDCPDTWADSSIPTASTLTLADSSRINLKFPEKLHFMLRQSEKEGLQHIVCWQPHGRSFMVRDKKSFVATVVPR
jgi:HSF-type DNA-binding